MCGSWVSPHVDEMNFILALNSSSSFSWICCIMFVSEKRGKILLSEIDCFSQGKSTYVLHSHSILQYITTTMSDDGSNGDANEVDQSMFLWLHYYERLLIFKGKRPGDSKFSCGRDRTCLM
jgi:hypothetical protein